MVSDDLDAPRPSTPAARRRSPLREDTRGRDAAEPAGVDATPTPTQPPGADPRPPHDEPFADAGLGLANGADGPAWEEPPPAAGTGTSAGAGRSGSDVGHIDAPIEDAGDDRFDDDYDWGEAAFSVPPAARGDIEIGGTSEIDAHAAEAHRGPDDEEDTGGKSTKSVARNTAIFSVATGLSRIAGLVREVVARSYFGTTGPMSAFTIAFQIPNLVRSLFADAALSAAFVPVFTEMLEQKRRKDALNLASTLFFVILAALGAITALFILTAGLIMPLFLGKEFDQELVDLTVGLSRVLFPIVVLLGLNGLLVGIVNAYGHFSIPAISPLVWNVVIIGALVVLRPFFHGDNQLYAYAIGVLIGTLVQLLMVVPVLGRIDFRLKVHIDLKDPRIRQVFRLMLPVTIGLGIINFDLAINSGLGTLVSDQAPSAIDAAFRIYMLPQGMFSVAVATVLFPTLSRYVARHDLDGLRDTLGTGVRQIFLLLVPAAVFCALLAHPITRLIYQRGSFDSESTDQVALALFWFSFSLPFAGANLLLTRTFFSLQQPWVPTKLAGLNLLVNAVISVATYKALGIAGLVIGTAVASFGMTVLQLHYLRPHLNGRVGGRALVAALVRICGASAVLGAASWLAWYATDDVVGRSLIGQLISMGCAATVGFCLYAALTLQLGIPEAFQIEEMVSARVRARRAR